MKKILLVTFLMSACITTHSVHAQQQKAKQELCNYHIAGKEGKKDRKKLEDRIEKLAAKFLIEKKGVASDYNAALQAVAHNVKENDFCITEAFVVTNDYVNPQQADAYTLYLYVTNEKLMGITFQNKKKIQIDQIFESKEDYTSFGDYKDAALETIEDYNLLLGNYYNIHYPQQTIALEWDSKMNSMTVQKNKVPTYYFSSKEGNTLLSNGFGFWQQYEIKIIPVDESTIMLIHNVGTKQQVVTIYRKVG